MPHAGAKTHDGVRSRHLVCRPGELVLNPSQIPATGIMTHCQFTDACRSLFENVTFFARGKECDTLHRAALVSPRPA